MYVSAEKKCFSRRKTRPRLKKKKNPENVMLEENSICFRLMKSPGNYFWIFFAFFSFYSIFCFFFLWSGPETAIFMKVKENSIFFVISFPLEVIFVSFYISMIILTLTSKNNLRRSIYLRTFNWEPINRIDANSDRIRCHSTPSWLIVLN